MKFVLICEFPILCFPEFKKTLRVAVRAQRVRQREKPQSWQQNMASATTTEMVQLTALDASLPTVCEEVTVDTTKLPVSSTVIPSGIDSLEECAREQIQRILDKEESNDELTEEEEDALDDGFVLCDLNIVEQKMRAWRRMFPRVKPFFALKCNPDVMVAAGERKGHRACHQDTQPTNAIAVLGQFQQEAGFDCASLSEIRLALQSTDNNPTRCIYANPQKAEADLDAALEVGVSCVTFDGAEELHKIRNAHRKQCGAQEKQPQPPQIVLRILVPDDHSSVPLGEKFGAPPSQIEPLAKLARKLELPIVGVSFHCGSGCHDPEAYGNAVKLAKDAMEIIDQVQQDRGIRCTLMDMGGGYPGRDGSGGDTCRFSSRMEAVEAAADDTTEEENEETAAKIAKVVVPLLDQLFPADVQVISEPGRYFVEAAFALCSRIYSLRVDKDENGTETRHYFIAQGVEGVFKDVILCGEEFVPLPLRMASMAKERDEVVDSVVHGPSGEGYDVVCKHKLPKLSVGDWLIWDRMGAYTLSIAARSGMLPIRYVVGGRG